MPEGFILINDNVLECMDDIPDAWDILLDRINVIRSRKVKNRDEHKIWFIHPDILPGEQCELKYDVETTGSTWFKVKTVERWNLCDSSNNILIIMTEDYDEYKRPFYNLEL